MSRLRISTTTGVMVGLAALVASQFALEQPARAQDDAPAVVRTPALANPAVEPAGSDGPTAEAPPPAANAPSDDALPDDALPDDALPDDDTTLTVAVISDLNGSYGATHYGPHVHEAVRWLTEDLRPDLVLSTGDMVAGQRHNLDYAAMWAGFHAAVTDPLTRAGLPLAVTPGNHDASGSPAFYRERVHYVAEWTHRRPAVRFLDDTFYPLYYAFEQGPALFVSLDATTTGPLDDDQRTWLRQVLTRYAHKPVKVVFGHVPIYPFAQGREHETLGDAAFEALLVDHGVDLYISGHHHAYYPGRRGALRLLGTACLGGGPRRLVGTDDPAPRSVAVLRITHAGIDSIEAFVPGEPDRPIDRRTLPEHLNDDPVRIWRDDL